jgi:hypothetical protein
MTTVHAEIENITAQIAELRALWLDLAAQGKHAEAVGVENEIASLERAVARYEIQAKAQGTERKRQQAVDAAESTLGQIERHKVARAELESVVVEVEAAAKAVDAAMERLRPAFTKCLASWPSWEKFKDPAQQEAYDEALGADKYPRFDALGLRLRLPVVLAILTHRGNRGLAEILNAADARF